MSANTNLPLSPHFIDHPSDDGYAHGAYVTVNGVKKMLNMHRVRLLKRFPANWRDENGKRTRAAGALTPEQLDDLGRHGIRFEPAEEPGTYHLESEVEVGKLYRQGRY